MTRLALLLALLPAPALAEGPLIGTWCHPEHGGMLFVEAETLGLGEHQVCDYADKPGEATMLETYVDCVEWRILDGEPVAVGDSAHKLFLERLEGGLILFRLDDEDWIEMENCDF